MMYCIDDLELIKLYGDFNTDKSQSLRLELYSCDIDPNGKCKDPKELINKNSWPYLLTLTNSQNYQQNAYGSDIIAEESLLEWHRLSIVSPFQKNKSVQVNSVETSDDVGLTSGVVIYDYFHC